MDTRLALPSFKKQSKLDLKFISWGYCIKYKLGDNILISIKESIDLVSEADMYRLQNRRVAEWVNGPLDVDSNEDDTEGV